VDESDGVIREGSSIAGLGRCATRLPMFTDAEIEAGLGKETCDQIERGLANLAAAVRQAKQLDT
jgi:hypothetical protein